MDIQNSPKSYKKTKNTTYSCQYHVIFCTKYRRSVLTEDIQSRLKELILEKQKELETFLSNSANVKEPAKSNSNSNFNSNSENKEETYEPKIEEID